MRVTRIASVCLLMTLSCAAARGAAQPPTTTATAPSALAGRRTDPARHPAIQSAIAELTKEIEAALRSGADAPRQHSDYFHLQPVADLQPAAVIAALRRPVGGDPRVGAYVKWQLLSGLPASLDAKTTADLVALYRSATPAPLGRPGMEKAQRDDLDRMIRNARESEADALTERFEQMVERVEQDNHYILAYRDALFARLAPSYEAIAAGFEDAVARMNAGIDPDDHARVVCKTVSQWVQSAAPEQLKQMTRAIQQLERKKGPEYYSKLYWSASNGRLQWSKTQASFAGINQLEAAQEELEEKIRNPTVPLKLKDEK